MAIEEYWNSSLLFSLMFYANNTLFLFAQSAGAVEYNDSFSAEG